MKRSFIMTAFLLSLLLLAGCGSITISSGESKESAPQQQEKSTAIAAYPETMHLEKGGQDTIQVSGAEPRELIWASSDRSVAIVDESGKVTAQGSGSCTITIASKTDSAVSSHVEVVVQGAESATDPAPVVSQETKDVPSSQQIVYYVVENNASSVYPAYALSSAEVDSMDAEETQFVINQIYAKNGYIFKKDDLQAYFSQMPWYTPVSNDVGSLRMSSLDQSNLNLLIKHRDGMSESPSSLGYLWTYRMVSLPLSESFVQGLSKADIQLLINTIYAKNGYIFEADELQWLFESQGWYRGITRDMGSVTFSKTEQQNLNLLLKYR